MGSPRLNARVQQSVWQIKPAGLATALNNTKARERGGVTHRMMAEDLDISPLAAEMILQALRQPVPEYEGREVSGESTPNVGGVD